MYTLAHFVSDLSKSTVFPRLDAIATLFFLLLKLAVIFEGGDYTRGRPQKLTF